MPQDSPVPPSSRLSGLDPAALFRIGLTPQGSEPGLTLPGYQIMESLGRGGMGEVYRAKQESLGREVAVKILRGDLGTGDWLPERFEREARTMAAMRQPNLVTVHDCLRLEDGRVAIVMELVRGGTLRQRIAEAKGGLPLPAVLQWTREIAAALSVAHAAGVVHRDVKPENILIDESGAARVTDFGLAMSDLTAATRYTQTGRALGTLGYMAPEQLRGEVADARSDIFSLGVMLYEMVTGRLPQGSFQPARELRPELPVALDRIIIDTLRPDPDQRPPSLAILRQRLDDIDRTPVHPRFSRRQILLAGAATSAAVVGAWLVQKPKKRPADPGQASPWRRFKWPADPGASAIVGGWQIDGATLVSDEQICILPIAYEMPSSWMLRLRFRRMTGRHSLAIFFRTPQGTGTFTLASWARDLGGVQSINQKTLQESGAFVFVLENERPYEWTVEYRGGLTRMWIDGHLKQERDITGQPLSVVSPWNWTPGPDSPALLLGSWMSSVRFEWLEWRPVSA